MTSIFELRKANLRRSIDFTTASCMDKKFALFPTRI